MTRVSITVTSHLGDVTITQSAESVLADQGERHNVSVLVADALDRLGGAYGAEMPTLATPPAVKRPEWGNVALVEDLRAYAEIALIREPRLRKLILAAATRIEELPRGDA